MKIKKEKIEGLLEEMDGLIEHARAAEKALKPTLKTINEDYHKSARNLAHYLAIRQHDLTRLQKQLGYLGMSRLARAESHIMASLQLIRFMLNKVLEKKDLKLKPGLSIKNANKLLNEHTKKLLGYRSRGRRVRIMVTQPTQAAYDYNMVYQMIENGMNCARINCAHDGPEVWQLMIKNIKQAATELGRKVKITMDLAGPKIRTGEIRPGARVRKFSPERDEMGNVTQPAILFFTKKLTQESDPNSLPIAPESWESLKVGDQLKFTDTRGSTRRLKVMATNEEDILLHCYDSSYISTGTLLYPEADNLSPVEVGEIPPVARSILLRINDYITVHRANIPGEPAVFDEDGNLIQEAHISCQLPEVFEAVKPGEPILFDDGKIAGVIEEVFEDSFRVRITRAKLTGARLKAEKGINFPDTDLHISGLTAKDREDLNFVVKHADAVNFSFVNTAQDVNELLDLLKALGAFDQLNIILKIETKRAFDNLPGILLAAMQTKYIGVMIARGDLAVETGWDNIGWVQKEILAICNAAHIPSVWATQVLENLAKKGLPSRSEITDATYSLRAECVMLNKGVYINDAISLLSRILTDLEKFQVKNMAMLPKLGKLSNK